MDFVGLIETLLNKRSLRETQKVRPCSIVIVANETKELIKRRINSLETLWEYDLKELIRSIHTSNSNKKDFIDLCHLWTRQS